jgi:hypothetical protein
MEDDELRSIWHHYDQKMEDARVLNLQSWALNLQCFHSLQTQKAASTLDRLARFKTRAVVFGVIWVLLLGLLVYGNHFENPYFFISLGMIILISVVVIVYYIREIRQIRRIDYSEEITIAQERLSRLQLSTIRGTRLAWLQLPFYCTWFWHRSWVHFDSLNFWLILFPITLFFVLLTIFLYRNISVDKLSRRWVRALLMTGPEYKSLVEAKKFLGEIDAFKQDLVLKKELAHGSPDQIKG